MTARIGHPIQTFSGTSFWPLDPRPADINIIDIGHALSLTCRFGGHSRHFYSVAQHSVLVATNVSRENALWGLLHDAGEAYLVDVPRPIKEVLNDFNEIENHILESIAVRFSLSYPIPEEVVEIDRQLLTVELGQLMTDTSWTNMEHPLDISIRPWSWKKAEKLFLQKFNQLTAED